MQRPRKRRVLNVYEKQRPGAGGKFRAVGGDELREEWEKRYNMKRTAIAGFGDRGR